MNKVAADLGFGFGMMQGDVLAQQQKDETDEIKRRNQLNAKLSRLTPTGGVANDLGLGLTGGA